MKILSLFALIFLLVGCAENTQTEQNQNLAGIDTELVVLDLQNQDPEAARFHLQEAQTIAPNDPGVLIARGYFDEKMGDIVAAKQSYSAAIRTAPNDPEIENDYGTFLYQNGEYLQALTYFEQAAANPENDDAAEASENAGLDEIKLKDPALAQADFVKANAEDPTLLQAGS